MKKLLHEGHKGSTAVETTILMPLIFTTLIMLLYMLMFVMAYVCYGNIANSIAHQMNMRQTGYQTALNLYYQPGTNTYKLPVINSFGVADNGKMGVTTNGTRLTEADITCVPNNKWVRSATYFALDICSQEAVLDGVADQFIMPFVQVNGIKVETSKELDFDSVVRGINTGARTAAGAVVRVSVSFTAINPFSALAALETGKHGTTPHTRGSSLFDVTVHGYDVIA